MNEALTAKRRSDSPVRLSGYVNPDDNNLSRGPFFLRDAFWEWFSPCVMAVRCQELVGLLFAGFFHLLYPPFDLRCRINILCSFIPCILRDFWNTTAREFLLRFGYRGISITEEIVRLVPVFDRDRDSLCRWHSV